MGVLELFGTLVRNNITSTSIEPNFKRKMIVNHLFLDFNSIIHVSNQKIITDINVFLQMILKNMNTNKIKKDIFIQKFKMYNMQDVYHKIISEKNPKKIISIFHKHFDDEYIEKLIITRVINTMLYIIRNFCNNKTIQTLMLAIDGVPSKGKMIEQKQRRYLGAIIENYKKRILHKYKKYLLNLDDYSYIAARYAIKWNRNKITPGTKFMHKLVRYLNNENIRQKIKTNRSQMEIILSDMYEIGEGEKKIVNYINKYLTNTKDTVMIYSPDADVILLCIILPLKKLYMLRHNQQTSERSGEDIYDLIDIKMLKNNISYYINNNPNFAEENFDIDRINNDIVCISTLFGNDFVPKMETLNVKKGFQNIMDAYLKTLLDLKHKGYYLVKMKNDEFRLNFIFLKCVIKYLIPEETDFIIHNNLYTQYISIGQIKYVFDYMEINSENLIPIYNQFVQQYENLKRKIKNNGNLFHFLNDEHFMISLKKAVNIMIDNQVINTSHLSNKKIINLLIRYYHKYKKFPRLNINLNIWSHSINDYRHRLIVKEKKLNEYQKEIYKFNNMLDNYYIKFNAQPLSLDKKNISNYYEQYFGITLWSENKKLTKEAKYVLHDYLEGILWVFNYYFNETSYINKWYYPHERAPLLRHFLMFLESITLDYFNDVYINLSKYLINDISKYFNPIEQLVYVSPMVPEIIELLPLSYQKYILSDNLDPFLQAYFVDINKITKRLWNEKISNDVDCRSIVFFNKCIIKSITKPSSEEDKIFLKTIRKIKLDKNSKKRSISKEPSF